VKGEATDYEGAYEIDWYIQFKNNKNWKLYYNGTNTVDELNPTLNGSYVNQWYLPTYMAENTCVPSIFSLGSVKRQSKATDNSPTSKISMENYMYVSINGNETDTEGSQFPSDDDISAHNYMLEYIGNNSGGVYSPTDDETTNYLVFSGKLLLQPIAYESSSTYAKTTNNFYDILTNGCKKNEGSHAIVPHYDPVADFIHNNLVKSEDNDEGRYYTRKFYTLNNPHDKVDDYPDNYLKDGTCGIHPPTEDNSDRGYEYKYSSIGDGTDTISKLPFLNVN